MEEELRERLLDPLEELRDLISLIDENAAHIDQVACRAGRSVYSFARYASVAPRLHSSVESWSSCDGLG